VRDYFTSDVEEILIDDEAAWRRVKRFFDAHMPDRGDLVRLYTGDKPIFSKHNLEDQIERIYKRVVQLKSGGAISIDQTEALTAIDVNSARSARSANSEETAARTNLEAAEEIARQLRLRDIGGLIVIDFIDMQASKHVRQVERAFTEAMSRDKARYDITRISKLGLMEVSRQRIKATKASSSFMPCPMCSGDGTVRTPEAAARMAYRKIQARVVRGDTSGVRVFLPPEVAMYLLNQKRDDLVRLETRHKVGIQVVPEERLKASQFEIEEIKREEPDVAPIVTADTVDEALAAGTLPALTRTPAPPPAAPPAAAAAGPEPATGEVRRKRRRRRRGRGRGSETSPREAEGRSAPREPVAAAGIPEDRPVFSEGPDEAEDIPGDESGPDGPEVGMPADRPLRAGGDARGDTARPGGDGQPHRRRRRRRRRGRGRRDGHPADASHPPGMHGGGDAAGAPAPAPHMPDGAGSHYPKTSAHDSWSAPAAASADAGPSSYGHDGPSSGETAAPQDGDDKKPRRRWWRRAFKG
jgi:ribonuclease E